MSVLKSTNENVQSSHIAVKTNVSMNENYRSRLEPPTASLVGKAGLSISPSPVEIM